MKLVTVMANKSYQVKEGCTVILLNDMESGEEQSTLLGGDKFLVMDYTGYDIYGEDRVLYNGKTYVLKWNSEVLNSLIEQNE